MNARAVRFPLFDSLRAIAVLLVLAYHALGKVVPPGSDATIRPYAVQLSVGVSIFFVISGFLLYRPFVAARVDGKRWIPAPAYAWRRFLRIVPAYWVALTVITLWLGLHGVLSLEGIPRYYLFGQVFSAESLFGGLPQAWSLSVEVGFYAFLPLYAFAVRRVPGRTRQARLRVEWLCVVLLLVAGEVYNAIVLSQTEAFAYTPLLRVFPTFLDHFALGMALAVASVAVQGRERQPLPVRVLDRFPGLAWAAAIAAFWAVSTRIGLSGAAGETVSDTQLMERRTLYALVALCVVLPAVFGDQTRGLVRKLLAWRPLLYLGLVSYGVFLYHVAVVEQIDRWDFEGLAAIHPYLTVVDVLIPSVVLASISYYVIERPALRLKRLVGPPTEPAPTEATAEPAPASPVTAARPAG
jgi:peptidoglycan/LPS O-acetylase OafA/YrhL